MNYLAHLWLADRTRTSLAGAILGDFVKGPDLDHLPMALATGVRIHRRIDSCTDGHERSRALRVRAPAGLRRYAGILLDLGFDHALARDWDTLHGESLPEFAGRAEAALRDSATQFPAPMRERLHGFAQLLCSYREPAGLAWALSRTAARLSRPYDADAAQLWLDSVGPELHVALPELLEDVLRELG